MHVSVKTALNAECAVAISGSAADLVRLGFNPSESTEVDAIKALAAALISTCEALRARSPAAGRHASLAITGAEEAAMWAVKAATAEAAQ